MRSVLPAVAVSLVLASLAGSLVPTTFAGDPPAGASPAPGGTPASPGATPVSPGGSGTDGDAAAKHAKRTACLKDAKAKKMVGAQRTAFVKNCVGSP